MKFKWILFVFVIFISVCHCEESKIKPEEWKNFSLDLYWAETTDFSDMTAGAKLSMPFAEIRAYGSEGKWTSGFSLFSNVFNSVFPVAVKIGKISAAGSLSKMNSPYISSGVSPFSCGVSSVSGIDCSLPGISSFSKDNGVFVQSSFVQRKGVVRNLKISAYHDYENDKEFVSSFYGKLQFYRDIRGEISFTAGFFPYSENNLTGWFNDERYYPEGNHFCSNLQLGFSSKRYSGFLMAGIYESPFGKIQHLYRMENKFRFTPFSLNFCLFSNFYEGLISSSDKKIESCIQWKWGIQYQYNSRLVVPFMWKIGMNAYGKIDLIEDVNELKMGVGIQGISSVTSFSLIGFLNGALDSEHIEKIRLSLKNASIQFKNTLYFRDFTLQSGGNFVFTPDTYWEIIKTEEKIWLNINLYLIPAVTHNNSVTFYQCDGNYEKCSITSGITVKISDGKYNRLRLTVKISGTWTVKKTE